MPRRRGDELRMMTKAGRLRRSARVVLTAALLGFGATTLAHGDPLAAGIAAHARGDYVTAARLLSPLARYGYARAQTMLGFMYESGQGVPQDYDAAAYWYRVAAEQGDVTAQSLLGLMYDKGHGVPLDDVAAYKWLNLAAAGAPKREHEYYLHLRDAVASKMNDGQIAEGQRRALEWAQLHRGF
jgi:TPR repeat protein